MSTKYITVSNRFQVTDEQRLLNILAQFTTGNPQNHPITFDQIIKGDETYYQISVEDNILLTDKTVNMTQESILKLLGDKLDPILIYNSPLLIKQICYNPVSIAFSFAERILTQTKDEQTLTVTDMTTFPPAIPKKTV